MVRTKPITAPNTPFIAIPMRLIKIAEQITMVTFIVSSIIQNSCFGFWLKISYFLPLLINGIRIYNYFFKLLLVTTAMNSKPKSSAS